jgi:hypothetical protein
MHKILVYSYIIHLLKSSTCFEQCPAHLQVYVVTVYMQPLVSSLSAGDCPFHQLRKNFLIYLYIIHLLKSSTCFEHCPSYLQEVYVVTVYMQPLVSSSLSAGDCPVHQLRKNFHNRCTGQSPAESDNTRGCIYTVTT